MRLGTLLSPRWIATAALCGAATLAVACVPARAALSYGDRITTAGLGPVEIGMTVDQASAALDRELAIESFNPPCGSVQLSSRFRVGALTTGDIVARIYINTPAFATRKRVRIGTSERTLRRRYGRSVSQGRNFYTQEPEYTFRRGNRAIVFGTRNGRVTDISTGRYPEVRYVEGCA